MTFGEQIQSGRQHKLYKLIDEPTHSALEINIKKLYNNIKKICKGTTEGRQ
jgi:hypothetical protein